MQVECQSQKRYQLKARYPGFQISIISILLRALRLCIACPKHWLSWEGAGRVIVQTESIPSSQDNFPSHVQSPQSQKSCQFSCKSHEQEKLKLIWCICSELCKLNNNHACFVGLSREWSKALLKVSWISELPYIVVFFSFNYFEATKKGLGERLLRNIVCILQNTIGLCFHCYSLKPPGSLLWAIMVER